MLPMQGVQVPSLIRELGLTSRKTRQSLINFIYMMLLLLLILSYLTLRPLRL